MDHYPVQECAAICVGNGNNRLSWPQSKMPLYNNEPLIPSKTAKALRRRSGGDFVYVRQKGLAVHRVSISPDQSRSQVWSTIKPGDTAVTAKRNSIQEEIEDLPSHITLPSKFLFSFCIPHKSLLEPMVSLCELTAHKGRCDCEGVGELCLRIISEVFDTASNKEVVKISLQWDLSTEYLANMVNQTVKVYSSVRDSSDSMLKSRQSHGTFEINEKDNPLLLVVNLCIHDEVMSWDDETIALVIEVVHNH